MATQSIDIVNNPANPANPTTDQLLALPAGGTVELYGDKPGTALQVRVTGLKREAEHAGQFLIEGFVRLPGEVREQLAHLEAAPAARAEGPVGLAQQADLVEEHVRPLVGLQRLAVVAGQCRFRVERVEVAEAADERDLHRPRRLGGVMRRGIQDAVAGQ